MDLDSIIARNIERRLKELGMSANAASVASGLPRDAIRDILTGKSKHPRADTIMKIARGLNVDPGYLLVDDTERRPAEVMQDDFDKATLPILYTVAAGAWLEADDYSDAEPDYLTVPRLKTYDGRRQWLEYVTGDSMDEYIPAGSYIHVVEQRDTDKLFPGAIVVVERTRAQGALRERSVKQVEIADDGEVQLWPRSKNPKWNKPLELNPENGDDVTVQIVGSVIRAIVNFT